MSKKIIIGILYIMFIFIIIFEVYNIIGVNKSKDKEYKVSEIKADKNIEVSDDCSNELDNYYNVNEIKPTSIDTTDNNKYRIKNKEDKVVVYYINEKEEEILYKVTNIYLEYLTKEDVSKIKEGIDIEGIERVNQILEDFE